MKLVGYKCEKCEKRTEELYRESEEIPEILEEKCECGGNFIKWNFKDNVHRWNFFDRGGI